MEIKMLALNNILITVLIFGAPIFVKGLFAPPKSKEALKRNQEINESLNSNRALNSNVTGNIMQILGFSNHTYTNRDILDIDREGLNEFFSCICQSLQKFNESLVSLISSCDQNHPKANRFLLQNISTFSNLTESVAFFLVATDVDSHQAEARISKIHATWKEHFKDECCTLWNKLANHHPSIQEDKQSMSANAKEIHTNVHNILQAEEMVCGGNCCEKNNQTIPTIKNSFVHAINKTLAAFLLGEFTNSREELVRRIPYNLQKSENSVATNLLKKIFPAIFGQFVLQKKRRAHHFPAVMVKPNSTFKGDVEDETVNGSDYRRRFKRETHVMMARYRKETIKSPCRKKRRKPTCRPDFENDRSKTTPFLNVSFTGTWEQSEEKTTVAPRVQKPLEMSEADMDFVYNRQSQQKGTRVEAFLGGGNSEIRVTAQFDKK